MWHATSRQHQLWLDGTYMSLPFLVRYGQAFGESKYANDEAARQLLLYANHLHDARTGLLFHAYDEAGVQAWADPATHHSRVFWCRSIGWYGMALIEVLDVLPRDHPDRPKLIALVRDLTRGLANYQDPASGLWFNVVDQPQQTGNWLETSGSSMYVLILERAVESGYIDAKYRPLACKGYRGVLSQLAATLGGDLHIANICDGTNVGNLQYYLDRPRKSDDLHGLGAFLLMNEVMRKTPCGQTLVASNVTVTSPLEYEVFQRRTVFNGSIPVRGVAADATRVEARVKGRSLRGPLPGRWNRMKLDGASKGFSGELPAIAGGFYRVEIRASDAKGRSTLTTVPNVGVGEVFVIAGQSNATNYGEVLQTTQSGMVTSFNGSSWVIANDPQPGTQDNSKKGSFIPSFGDALFQRYHVPIGVACVGHGSTSVRQWLPAGEPVQRMPTMKKFITTKPDGTLASDGTLFNGLMMRIRQLDERGGGGPGFRAVLWHQGESDSGQSAEHEISASVYERMLAHVIAESHKQAGSYFPWIVAEVSYHSPEDPLNAPLREAQRHLWERGVAVRGPDTDTLTSAFRQNNGKGVHFNDAGLKAHGLLWAESVSRYVDGVLGTTE